MSRSLPFEDAAIERQTALIRYAEGQAKTINPVLLAIIDYLTTRIPKEGELITTKKDLDQLIKDVTKRLDKEFTGWEDGQFLPMFKDVIETELEFDQSATEAIVDDYTAAVPPVKKVESAAFLNPLVINKGAEAIMFDKYIKDWKPYQINRVIGIVRGGFATGMTTQQIVRDICGTKSAKYRDGALNKTRADIQGMVHTTVQHLASTARNEFSQQNKDLIIGMRDIATLDTKTSSQCKARDQTVYLFEKYGKNHPSPPYHRRCRTTQVYEFSSEYDFLKEGRKRPAVFEGKAEKVGGTRQYYDILKNQPAAVIDDALGKTKGKIFRNAGLTAEEFKKASVDQLYNPLSIEDMAKKNKKIAEYLKKLKKEGEPTYT